MDTRTMIDAIQGICHSMRPGQIFKVSCKDFQRAFPCGWPSIYETHEQAFLSRMIGAEYGGYRVYLDPINGDYTISRHEVHDHSPYVYVDPDRAHLYRRMPDGSLRHIEEQLRKLRPDAFAKAGL